ncbi:MAG TPA: helix-turn-helix domain-containing protein [Solirubrobacteraceae bacterium]|nr:helix-turn-helix domain-containing protein [Solirubrobacteraceae bacterium]
MVDGVRIVARGLRERREEIEEGIFRRVREAVRDPVANANEEYVAGLRVAVAAAVDYGLSGIEGGVGAGRATVPVPREAVAQAKLAARSGVSLDAVLQRYIVGHALLWDYVMEEADKAGPPGGALREMSRAQSMLLERMTAVVSREYGRERERVGRSREQRLVEGVRALLAGESATDLPQGMGEGAGEERAIELVYQLGAEHLGVIARGAGAPGVLRELAGRLDRRLLCVEQSQGTVWAWLGGQRTLRMSDVRRALRSRESPPGVTLAIGEPARGLEGWRATHRQAQAALLVAMRRSAALTCYADVALLAAALKDPTLARELVEIYVAPLSEERGATSVLADTLRGYLAAERNASSAAARLKIARSTLEKRLRIAEERLGRPLHPCPVELEIALQLDALDPTAGGNIPAGEQGSG